MDADDSSGLRTQESGVRSKGRDFFTMKIVEGGGWRVESEFIGL
jgi:hypothetical protein